MPKDLLEYLESGDRTMEDLKGQPKNWDAVVSPTATESLARTPARVFDMQAMESYRRALANTPINRTVEFRRPGYFYIDEAMPQITKEA